MINYFPISASKAREGPKEKESDIPRSLDCIKMDNIE